MKLLALLLLLPALCFADVTAKSYIVMDMDGHVLLEKNPDDIRSIASITKLITARSSAAFDQNELIQITPEDVKAGHMRSSPLRAGQSYTRAQLTNIALVSSDNIAAIALGRTLDHPPGELPEGMHWVEGSGLDPANVASARDLAEIARTLVNTDIARASVQEMYMNRKSTNPLLGKPGWEFGLSKTGFINQAGGCVVSVFKDGTGRGLVAVVLGSTNVPQRWRDLYSLRKQLDPDSVFASPSGVQFVRQHGHVTKRIHRYK
jgi:D-alanyl-D-alanine endopeptidase (penicillin-binding protein 7)